MPRARRGGTSGPLKSVVTKGVTSSKSSRAPKKGILGSTKSARAAIAKKPPPNRGKLPTPKARPPARPQRGPKATPKAASKAGKERPALKAAGKSKGKGARRIKGAIITRRAGG